MDFGKGIPTGIALPVVFGADGDPIGLGFAIKALNRGERHIHPASGYKGGEAGAKAHAEIQRSDGTREAINSKIVTRLSAGDRVELATAGGGGFGAPSARTEERITADKANRKISNEAAQ